MKTIITLKRVFYFWAVFDLFYIIRFIWINIEQGRIPLIDDVVSFSNLFPQQGLYSLFLFSFSLLLNVSIVFSAFFLFRQWKSVHWFIYAQTPLRILFVIPSLSVLPWLFKTFSIRVGVIFLFVTIISEVLKVVTVYLAKKGEIDNQAKGSEK